MVAVDKEIGKSPVVVAAENFDLGLKERFTVADVLLKLRQETQLMSWMQQSTGETQIQRRLPPVDRVIVHLEQMSSLNLYWQQFGSKLGSELQKLVTDSTCIVKMSSAHLFRSGGVTHHLGDEIVNELSLVPLCFDNKSKRTTQCSEKTVTQCSKKRRFDDVEPSSQSENDSVCDTETMSDVEPSSDSESESIRETESESDTGDETDSDYDQSSGMDVDYRKRKEMSAAIFRYLMVADEDRQTSMGVSVVREVQEQWRGRMERNPNIKLDNVGDALLHGLNDILCGGSNYRQLVPSNVALDCNRTVVVAVCPNCTYWCVIYCTWNILTVENLGCYMSLFNSKYYNSEQTVRDIRKSLMDNVGVALTDLSGGETYHDVNVIKMVVKQLKGYEGFKTEHAGALTKSTVTAMKQICDEAAGSNSLLTEKKDKIIGSSYIRKI